MEMIKLRSRNLTPVATFNAHVRNFLLDIINYLIYSLDLIRITLLAILWSYI